MTEQEAWGKAFTEKAQAIGAMSIDSTITQAIVKYLCESETKLTELLSGQQPPDSAPGSVEFGLTLYCLKEHELLHPVWDWLGKPDPNITHDMLDGWKKELEGQGVIASDGTLVSYSKYAQLDFGLLTGTPGSIMGWAEAFVDYVYHRFGSGGIHPFGNDGQVIHFRGEQLSLALLGDWGTGVWQDGNDAKGPAMVLLDQVLAQDPKPDLTIHLGDVYYTGSADGKHLDGNETIKFTNLWKKGTQGSFTLNSNHEMYPGANGFFDDAMTSSLFSQQAGASYFALMYGDNWAVIGLDSVYDVKFPDNTLVPFYMEGLITDAHKQLSFIKGLDLTGRKVIVLTHHNPVTTDGTEKYGELWDNVTGALADNPTFTCAKSNGAPQYWFWGHIHNGIIYNESSFCGARGTKGRCTGHAAIPFGSAYALAKSDGDPIDTVEYFANTPYKEYASPTLQQKLRVLNGFTMLTLTESGITEFWYEQGNTSPVWPTQ
jgi:hypothetical protein